MGLTQESVLSLLLSEGGKVKKSELVGKFKGAFECVDPAEKERNKELFKTFVNNVAFVKEIDGVRYVLVKKKYQHLLEGVQQGENPGEQTGSEETEVPDGGRCEDGGGDPAGGGGDSAGAERDSAGGDGDPSESPSPFMLALQRSRGTEHRVKRTLNFQVPQSPVWCSIEPSSTHNKPFALPLRVPPAAPRAEPDTLRGHPYDPPDGPDAYRYKRRQGSVETGASLSPPQIRRAAKSTKVPEEPKEPRFPSVVPLEQSEHEWLVKCALGHWSQVYGLLMNDSQLAEKRDFMTGFTALHWAAKCGNSDMLAKIIDLSKKGGVDIDINAKTHGGYTALHIAALHDQEFILNMLVGEYGADATVRDNCGKRAYHYLHKGISEDVREMMGEPKPQLLRGPQDWGPQERDEPDLLTDLRGLHSISRLFQPHLTGHRKKTKQRPSFYSLTEESSEGDRGDRGDRDRSRVLSDVFM
ncbi:ankyrin repeat domain-containing protein SOWAHA [Genypterus blacodes]|uniref:ankyrin repeat domain-containing protein SOWAHA n=1 Tax=Genypterus blacodes TaxID=154954 RepID=UPI003F76DD74